MDSRIYILTHKQLTGQLSALEIDEFKKLSLNPELRAISEEIAYLWNISNNYFPKKDWRKEDAKQAVLNKIRQAPASITASETVTSRSAAQPAARKINWIGIAAAAVIAILLIWAIYSWFSRPEVIEAKNHIEYAEILDNTRIWLDNDAQVTILKKTDAERRVALNGVAFFDVNHDPSKTFTVELGNNIFAEVLGTSFTAQSTHSGNGGKISVREGEVRLFSTSDSSYDLTLSAGQSGVIDPAKNVMETDVASEIMPFAVDVSQLSFDNTPLNEVLDQLGLHYGVRFQYDKEVLQRCRYSAGVPANASLNQTLSGIQGVHEGLQMTEMERNTYSVTGTCH